MLLCRAVEGGDPAVAELVVTWVPKEHGPRSLRVCWVSRCPGGQHRSRRGVRAVAQSGSGAFRVVPGDEEWPSGLDDLRHAEPIQRRGGEAFRLWLRGRGICLTWWNGLWRASGRGRQQGTETAAYSRTRWMWLIRSATPRSRKLWPRSSWSSQNCRPPLIDRGW